MARPRERRFDEQKAGRRSIAQDGTSSSSSSSRRGASRSRRRRPSCLLLALTLCLIAVTSATDSSSSTTPNLAEPFQTSFSHLPHVPCVSLFHRNGREGCGTLARDTMTGRLVHWSTVVDDNGNNADGGGLGGLPPYVAVMDENEFTAENVGKLRDFAETASKAGAGGNDDGNDDGAGVLRGILVINATATADADGDDSSGYNSYYSPAPQSPQGQGTPSSALTVGGSYAWNPNGDGNTLVDYYGLPVGYVPDESVGSYLYSVSNAQSSVMEKIIEGGAVGEEELYPAVVSEFNYYMGPDGADSVQCLSWKDTDGTWSPKCLPLGGNSVWAVAGSPEVAAADGDGDQDGGRGRRRAEDQQQDDDDGSGKRPIVMMATSIDSTSMFHDVSPGANSAATSILSLLMAAKLVGSSLPDATLDGFSKRIMFGFFQAESYGYVGSRSFLRDVAYPGFQCDEGRTVPASAKKAKDDDGGDDGQGYSGRMGCLNPLRTDLDFQDLGDIVGMVAVDQIGVLDTDKTFYVHGTENDDEDEFLANVLVQLGSDDWTVESSSVDDDGDGDDDDDGSPLPPTPLQSLVKLSGGAVGGAVLAGYDAAYADGSLYHFHLDRNTTTRPMDMDSVAMAATVLARAAVAAAYDDGEGDYEGAAQYAANLVPALGSDDETLLTLADCLLVDGNCDLLLSYGKVERTNGKQLTGHDLNMGIPLGTPPNYYPSVYDSSNGQGFVQVNGKWYGSYNGDDKYGEKDADTFLIRPSLLEMSLHGMLNDFLGRGSSSGSAGDSYVDGEDGATDLTPCEGTGDCSSVPYCSEAGDEAVCTGGKVCVCSRAHYHPAVDEAILPAPNNFTGMFLVRDDDEGVSAMYTEPYWSSSVGVRVYTDAGGKSGNWALGAGLIVAACCVVSTALLKRRLKKEKLY